MRRLNEFHNEISPANLLPAEILSRIADLASNTSWGRLDQVVIMTQVCRYWRLVLASHPWVWADITVKTITPVCLVTAALKNSRQLPLHLDLQIHLDGDNGTGNSLCRDLGCGCVKFLGFRPPPDPFAILSLLELHHKRIQKLQIRFLYHGKAYGHGIARLIQHPFFRRSFDALDSLSLSSTDACYNRQQPFGMPAPTAKIEGNFPRLRSLTLSGVRHILHPDLRCPILESLSIDFPANRTEGYGRLGGPEVDFLEQHHTLTAIVIKEQAVDQPVNFSRLKSVAFSGGGFDTSIDNGVYPTLLTVMKSLTIQTNNLITITASDEDGNSIACSVRRAGSFRIVEAWFAYLQFAQDDVEDLYLDLTKDVDSPYDVICGLSNVRTVHIAWAGDRTKRVIEQVTRALDRRGVRMGRWLKHVEDSRTSASRNDAFKSSGRRVGWECV